MARKHDKREPRTPLLVLTSNETEASFFSQMRRDCRYANMDVVQKDPDIEDMIQMIKTAGKLKRIHGYTSVWCITNPIDLKMSTERYTEYENLAKRRKVSVVYNNPGIELWFYLHFGVPSDDITNVDEVIEGLRTYIPDYSSTPSFFTSESGMQFYLRLFPNKAQAALYAGELIKRVGRIPWGDTSRLGSNMTSFLTDVTDACGRCYVSHSQFFSRHEENHD